MPVTVQQLLDGGKDAAQAAAPALAPGADLPPVLMFAHGDTWRPWAVPPNLRDPLAERELLGAVIPGFLHNHGAHAAVFSFTAWIKPTLRVAGVDPRSSLAVPGMVKDEAGEREQVVLIGVDRDGLLLHAQARLKRRAMLAPHLGPWEDAPPLPGAQTHTGGLPDTPRAIVRALLVGVGAVGMTRAA